MKLSETGKKDLLKNAIVEDYEINDGIVYLHEGFKSHKTAVCERGPLDIFFDAFERTWGANAVIKSLNNPQEDIVLELGCSETNIYDCFSRSRVFPNYIGMDIRKDFLGMSKQKNRKDALLFCADLTKKLPLKDASVQSIVMMEFIEHITREDNMTVFKECFRVLKPGGKIFVSSPMNIRGRVFHNLEEERHLGHVYFWEAEEFEEEMKGLGYSNVDTRWGFSVSSKIKVNEIKKKMEPAAASLIEDISAMYGSSVARAVALSASNIPNGGCRISITK